MPEKQINPISLKNQWQLSITIVSLIAILTSILLHFFPIFSPDIPLFIAIIIGGIPCVFNILSKLMKGDLGADSLAALALITSVILHQYLAAVLIILMIATGQALEFYAMRKASSVLYALAQRMPSIAHRKQTNNIEDIPLTEIKIDDEIIIYPHEICPVDGMVIAGQSTMDESYLTGEPYQISKAPGTSVISGAINGDSVLTIHATKLASDSRYASIVKVLHDAEQKRPTIRRLGDKIGAIFAPVAFLFALLTWYLTGDSIRFLAVLVIATPCPLLIAIPITLISAISMAAKHAIIIKDPTVLEQLPTCRTAIFDKTGTLTYGKPILTNIISAGLDTNFLLQYVASIERYSKHPLASAILQAAKKNNLPLLNATNISEKPGEGLTGTVAENILHITSRKKFINANPEFANQLPPVASGLECVILFNNKYAATFQLHDMPRKESKSFIAHLTPSHQFNKIMLVSGDRESEVKYLGDALHLTELYASQTPDNKLAIVRAERKKAATLFMGDGINDAPALSAATVGIAFGQHSNITSESAGAVIMENSLIKVDELIHLSLATRNIALQSAIGGMLLSLIGMGFAAAGFIPPVTGALLQEFIDIIAIVNSLRLIWNRNIEIDIPETNHL